MQPFSDFFAFDNCDVQVAAFTSYKRDKQVTASTYGNQTKHLSYYVSSRESPLYEETSTLWRSQRSKEVICSNDS